MTNNTNPADSTILADQAERYSLIEMDPTPPVTVRQAIPLVSAADLVSVVPAVPFTGGQAIPAAVQETLAPVAAVDRALADELAPIVAEGARNAAVTHLVRGGVLPADVNPIAGFNSPAAYAAAVPATAASAAVFAAHAGSAAATMVPTTIAPTTITAPAAVVEARPTMLSGRDMVAGAAAAGEAVLVGWSGKGELTREQISARLETAGLPTNLTPAARTAHAQAGRSTTEACGTKYDVTAERRGSLPEGAAPYAARWNISTPIHGAAIGQPASTTIGCVTLMADGTLATEGPADLCAAIQAEYQRRIAGEVFQSADVTAWMRGVVCGTLGGVQLGGVYYVPRTGAARAEALCTSVAAVWGTNWITPALPVATSDQLRRGLVRGLSDEAAEILADLATQRKIAAQTAADGKRKTADIGTRAAATFMLKLRTVAERALSYGALLGPELVTELRATVLAALETVEPLMDPAAQRGWLIWEELEREQTARERSAEVTA